jgi:hypothetical protein
MYKGTLASVGPWEALVTFQQFIILADKEGVVDMTADAIARETTIPRRVIDKGIAALELPDPDSKSPDAGGRRITRLSDLRTWGWKITNYIHYRKLRSEDERREYHRQYWHTRKTQHGSTNSTQAEAVSSKQKAEGSDTTAAARPDLPSEFREFQNLYPKRGGGNPWPRALKAIRARLSEGHSWEEITSGVCRYREFIRATGRERTEFVLQAATFCGPDKRFLESWDLPATKAEVQQEQRAGAARDWLAVSPNA